MMWVKRVSRWGWSARKGMSHCNLSSFAGQVFSSVTSVIAGLGGAQMDGGGWAVTNSSGRGVDISTGRGDGGGEARAPSSAL